jgi:hypothetical protein
LLLDQIGAARMRSQGRASLSDSSSRLKSEAVMQSIDETTLTAFRKAAAPQSSRLVDFDKAEVRPGFIPNTFFLIVSGTVPCANMRVELIPLIYVQRPDYWEIEVVAFLPGPICLPQVRKYTETIPLDGILGTAGIEVVGATRRERICVP